MNPCAVTCPNSATSRNVDLGKFRTDTIFASATLPLKQTNSESPSNQYPRNNEGPHCASLDELRPVSGRLGQSSTKYRSQNNKPAVNALNTASANDDVTTMSPEDLHLISFLDKLEQEIDLSILKPNQQDTSCLALEPNVLIPSNYNEACTTRKFQMMPNDNTALYLLEENRCPAAHSQMPPPHIVYGEGDRRTLQYCTSKAENFKERKHFVTKVDSTPFEAVENNEKQKGCTSSNGGRTVKSKGCALGTSEAISLARGNPAKPTTENNILFPHREAPASSRFEDFSTFSSSLLGTSEGKQEVLKKYSQVETLQVRKDYRPIHALNAYNFFFIDERDRILSGRARDEYDETKKELLLLQHLTKDRSKRRQHRRSHGKIDFISLSRTIGRRWRKLPEEQKEFYRDVAASDLERYHQELSSQCIL